MDIKEGMPEAFTGVPGAGAIWTVAGEGLSAIFIAEGRVPNSILAKDFDSPSSPIVGAEL